MRRILAVLCATHTVASAQAPLVADRSEASRETREWIAAHTTVLSSLDSGDLGAWRKLVGSARLIGLGEQTHGTHEFFNMKRRLITDGVDAMHVRVVAFEEAPALMAQIDSVIGRPIDEPPGQPDGGDGKYMRLDSLVRRMAPQWRTVEVRDFFATMRLANLTRQARKLPMVHFIGVDSRGGPPAARDSIMAENAIAALSKLPDGERLMLWSHNLHVGMLPNRIGSYLHQRLGAQYVVLGFATAEGTYRAHAPGDSARAWSEGHALEPSQAGSVESAFLPTSGAALLVDVRGIVADPRGAWFRTPRDFHHEGSNVDDGSVQVYNIGETFHILMFIPKTTSARGLSLDDRP